VLINGASGGIGSTAVQLAAARGARVIGTASAANQDYLSLLGAEPVTYGEGMAERVRALAPGGVDAALDVAGNGILPELIDLAGGPRNVVTLADFWLPVDRTFPLADIAEAHRISEQGHVRGRLVLVIR
jgi:NADPH:quinone reductase-like Zn-dependent oxidoreductase